MNWISSSFSLPGSISGFHQHSQGDLWEDPGGGVWYQQWGETRSFFFLLKPLHSCSLSFSCPLLHSLFSSFPLLFLLWFSSSVCGLPYSLCLKRRGEKTLLSASFDSSHAKLPAFLFSPALFSTRSLFTPQLCLTLSLSLTFGILPANKFLTSHKVSVIWQENKHSASQPVSCLSSQSVSLLSSQPDGYLLSGTVMQAGKSGDQACQQVCTCQQVLVMLLPH